MHTSFEPRNHMPSDICLYFMGPAKQFHPDGKVTFAIQEGMTIAALREMLVHWLAKQKVGDDVRGILDHSVFADTKKILREKDTLQAGSEYVLIPPISGG